LYEIANRRKKMDESKKKHSKKLPEDFVQTLLVRANKKFKDLTAEEADKLVEKETQALINKARLKRKALETMEYLTPLSAQQEHDLAMDTCKPVEGNREAFKALMKLRKEHSSQEMSSTNFDPIEVAIRNNPRLTREKAEKMAEAFGFL